jgi:hypothetical protein
VSECDKQIVIINTLHLNIIINAAFLVGKGELS